MKPPPSEQISFLRKVQRILNEGSFVATYKYALLHSLADLAVLRGNDSGDVLRLSTFEIAERFIELYWEQAAPYQGKGTLRQNTGKAAAILTRIEKARSDHAGSLGRLKQQPKAWRSLVKRVESTVCKMPPWKLQTVGSSKLPFLYGEDGLADEIELRPGVAYCLRAYHPLLTDLVRGAWVRYIRRNNTAMLGTQSDLQAFLFGSERDPALIARCRDVLHETQEGRCLYCQGKILKAGQVDHFIPWSLYPANLGHNLVLAHNGCNGSKSDHIAAEAHLAAWVERGRDGGTSFCEQRDAAQVDHDREASERIAGWAYGQVAAAGGQTWVRKSEFVGIGEQWRDLLPNHQLAYPAAHSLEGVGMAADKSS